MAQAMAVSRSMFRGASACMVARLPTTTRPQRSPAAAAAGQGSTRLPPAAAAQSQCLQQRRRSFSGRRFLVCCASASGTVGLEIQVEGMKCGGCSSRVEEALKAMQQVKGVQVDLDSKLAKVDVAAASLEDAMKLMPVFVSAINELGFEAQPSTK